MKGLNNIQLLQASEVDTLETQFGRVKQVVIVFGMPTGKAR